MLEYFSASIEYEKDPSILSDFRIIKDGEVEARGYNFHHALGLSSPLYSSYTAVPIPVRISQITQQRSHTFAIGVKGELYACGDNLFGQLGAPGNCRTFTKVALPEKVVRVIACNSCSFVIGQEGRLYASGMFYTGTGVKETFFVHVHLPSLVVDLTLRDVGATAMLENGEEWSWDERSLPSRK